MALTIYSTLVSRKCLLYVTTAAVLAGKRNSNLFAMCVMKTKIKCHEAKASHKQKILKN